MKPAASAASGVFDPIARLELQVLLGSPAAVQRLEGFVTNYLRGGDPREGSGYVDGMRPKEFRDTNKRLADQAAELLVTMQQLTARWAFTMWTPANLTINTPDELVWAAGREERDWKELVRLLQLLSEQAQAAADRTKVKTREMHRGLRIFGTSIVYLLEAEGLKRSRSPRSKMVRAFGILLTALNWDNDPRHFVDKLLDQQLPPAGGGIRSRSLPIATPSKPVR